jgi:hypothetical protein
LTKEEFMGLPYETKTATLHSAAAADANGTEINCEGLATICCQVSGTVTSATITWEGTVDGTNWVALLGWNRTTGVKALNATAAGLFVIDVTGLYKFRAPLDWTTGSVTVKAKGTSLPTTTLVTAS